MSGVLKWQLEKIAGQMKDSISKPVLDYLHANSAGNYQSAMKITAKYSTQLASTIEFYRHRPNLWGIPGPERVASAEWTVTEPNKTEITLDSKVPAIMTEIKMAELLKDSGMKERLEELYRYVRDIRL
ncbi:MAG TPA: hypothetical protein VLJ21_02945 [Candidatus Binatia bacterium]|nr:hypothetical protein [Candidatus Binatia bacterium]